MHLVGLAVILTVLAAPFAVAGAPPTTLSAFQESVDAMIVEVVPLTYARAGELVSLHALPDCPATSSDRPVQPDQ